MKFVDDDDDDDDNDISAVSNAFYTYANNTSDSGDIMLLLQLPEMTVPVMSRN